MYVIWNGKKVQENVEVKVPAGGELPGGAASFHAHRFNQSSSDISSSDETPVGREAARRGEAGPRWFGELGPAEFEMEFYERILARRPDYVVVLQALGDVLSHKGLYARSLEVHRRLVALVPHDCVAPLQSGL